jgi:hypothetical protein|tara:strand:+ start:1210 stop:1473 length:264 start_codon:yes stop_codon:yes gene_type:complete
VALYLGQSEISSPCLLTRVTYLEVLGDEVIGGLALAHAVGHQRALQVEPQRGGGGPLLETLYHVPHKGEKLEAAHLVRVRVRGGIRD